MAFCSCSGGLIDWCASADDLCKDDAKNAHLVSLDVAAERLRLVHTLAAAVTGTTNVRKACSEARLGLGRVVVVSYVSAAMGVTPGRCAAAPSSAAPPRRHAAGHQALRPSALVEEKEEKEERSSKERRRKRKRYGGGRDKAREEIEYINCSSSSSI
uniref:Uncharacterized protein n=1 Tax=Oryza rufipogon TaxID=4529 RepID=A0A0E0P348_ORYRU